MAASAHPSESAPPHHGISAELLHLAPERRIKMLTLACLVFFTTCGGAFGLEPLIGAVGPGLAVVLILVTPLAWSLPTSLMVAELAALIPEEGGYYVWIRETFGSFWAVQQACWVMATSIVWLAMYPVLFVTYLSYFFPFFAASADASHFGRGALLRWLIAVLVIAAGMVLNLGGAREVGISAKFSISFVLGAFAIMLLVWFGQSSTPVVDIIRRDLAAGHGAALLLGLSFVVFNYSSWDNVSTYAREVDQPQRSYPRAIGIALVLAVLAYVFPVLAGISVTTKPEVWSADAGWPVIAQLIGGRWLGSLIAAAGLVSMSGLFNAQVLYSSRLPYVLACDGWLPRTLAKVSGGSVVPRVAVVVVCAIAALFAALSFGSLAIISTLLYAGALTLEFLALIVLRIRRPHAHRSFRIPGGWFGLSYVCVTPFAFAALVLLATLRDWRAFPGQLVVVAGVVGGAAALYCARRRIALRTSADQESVFGSEDPSSQHG